MNPLTKIKNVLNNRRIKQQKREEATLQEVKRRKQEFEFSKPKTKEEKLSELEKQDDKIHETVDYIKEHGFDMSISEIKSYAKDLVTCDEINLDKIVDELKMNAWTNSGNRDKYLLVRCNVVIGLHGYVNESSHEYFEPSCLISYNDIVLYGEESRSISAYRNETYSIGKFKNLNDALFYLFNLMEGELLEICTEKPEIENPWPFEYDFTQYDFADYDLPNDVMKIIDEYGFAMDIKDGVIKLSLPHKSLNAPDLHKALHFEEIKGTSTYNYSVNPDLKMIITSENSSYSKKTELQIFDTKEKFLEGVKSAEKTIERIECAEEKQQEYDLDDIDICGDY